MKNDEIQELLRQKFAPEEKEKRRLILSIPLTPELQEEIKKYAALLNLKLGRFGLLAVQKFIKEIKEEEVKFEKYKKAEEKNG